MQNIKSMIEMKIEGNTLDPKTYTALLAQDFNDC